MTNSGSWVVDVEKIIADGQEQLLMRSESWLLQSIYKVPEWFQSFKSGAYKPQVVSLGPFHHKDKKLKLMEQHKLRAVVALVSRSGKPLKDFIAAVSTVAGKLEQAYGGDLDQSWRGDNRGRFVEMMVLDGCFLLEILALQDDYDEHDDVFTGRSMSRDYDTHDPVFTRRSMWPVIRSDMLAIENQLPLLLLRELISVQEGKTTKKDKAELVKTINRRVLRFLRAQLHQDASVDEKKELLNEVLDSMGLGLHPLELYHRSLVYTLPTKKKGCTLSEYQEDTMPSAVEMHEAGIKFRKSSTNSLVDVHFYKTKVMFRTVLSMPEVTVNDSTEHLFLNLMAYERLHCGFDTHVTAYVIFMDNLIESARDVALWVLKNMLGSNEETAKLFNGILSNGALMGKYSAQDSPGKEQHNKKKTVQSKVKNHCKMTRYKWRASLKRTYFGNPWTFISLVAAIILLVATLVQTFYTVVPFYKSSH